MSSNPTPADVQVTLPRTTVPEGLDPVGQARAELKAALFAIEDKVNVPRRVAGATERGVKKARIFSRRHPGTTAAAVLGAAALVGTAVWGIVSLYTSPR